MKKVAILDVGEFGYVGRSTYAKQAQKLKSILKEKGVDSEILEVLPKSFEEYTDLIFLTREMLEEARKIKKINPEKAILLCTGLVRKGDSDGGIIIIRKGDYDTVDNILKHIK